MITVLTAQNTQGVHAIQTLPTQFINEQLTAIFSDLKIDSIKIGMLHNADVIDCIVRTLSINPAKNIVLDPVMIATSGDKLIDDDAIKQLQRTLLPLVSLITPNIPEAEVLCDVKITSKTNMQHAAKTLANMYQTSILVKGGHLPTNDSDDFLYVYPTQESIWLPSKRIDTVNTHGTGCSLSSAIATLLAKNCDLIDAVKQAKIYITRAIAAGKEYQFGHGCGPINHLAL